MSVDYEAALLRRHSIPAQFLNLAQRTGISSGIERGTHRQCEATDTLWNEDLSDLQEGCHETPTGARRGQWLMRLAEIVTRLWLGIGIQNISAYNHGIMGCKTPNALSWSQKTWGDLSKLTVCGASRWD